MVGLCKPHFSKLALIWPTDSGCQSQNTGWYIFLLRELQVDDSAHSFCQKLKKKDKKRSCLAFNQKRHFSLLIMQFYKTDGFQNSGPDDKSQNKSRNKLCLSHSNRSVYQLISLEGIVLI